MVLIEQKIYEITVAYFNTIQIVQRELEFLVLIISFGPITSNYRTTETQPGSPFSLKSCPLRAET